jgi:3'-phosphoadenosine 5'-phosphosulfate sulfotransferase (PAPS reductase)/FAD synthetase
MNMGEIMARPDIDQNYDVDNPATSMGYDVDPDYLDDIETEAMEMVQGWVDEFGYVVPATSGGIDSSVIAHMASRAGAEVSVSVLTREAYPKHLAFAEWQAEEMGLRHDLVVPEFWTKEWVKRNPEWLFPEFELIEKASGFRQREHLAAYSRQQNVDLMVFGRRVEQNFVPHEHNQTGGRHQGFPIRTWGLEETLSYIEKHDLRISPVYRLPQSRYNGDGPWHLRRRMQSGPDGESMMLETTSECWYNVREFACDSFWEQITDVFEEGESMADSFEQRGREPYELAEYESAVEYERYQGDSYCVEPSQDTLTENVVYIDPPRQSVPS